MKKLTKDERRGVADALMRAKNHLWDGTDACLKQEYICHALDRVSTSYQNSAHAHVELAKAIIEERIRPYDSLDVWLCRQPGVSLYDGRVRPKHIQQHRLAWMNMLIKEFSK